ncbi:serine hydrolase [Reyranella sp.]|uniref:serine hydrolase domain-containing protein n=1 Tax=Reyranella sp. TaxID=1929291 RepID=UPI0027311BD9|nr:serine hydrolase [Reyranella sp.]MDP2376010.1 serine hydrolase [Reyranella sp.]
MARLLMLLLVFALAMPAAAETCDRPQAIGDGWSIAVPDEVGIDGARLCEVDAFLSSWPQRNIHAVVVVRRGQLVFERYFPGQDNRWTLSSGFTRFSPTEKHDIRSISKSVTSLLVGIALGEGKFPPLDSPMIDVFPEYASLRTPEKARITFRHLLTMSHGLVWDENVAWTNTKNNERLMFEATDPYRYTLEQPVALPPGVLFNYSGGATSLLAGALMKATGRKVDDYAKEKLFTPLGITDFEWLDFSGSNEIAAFGGLRLRPRDLAKIGQLMSSGGMWNGNRVVPKDWVAESIQPRVNTDSLFYYGYQWWLGRSLLRGRNLTWIAGIGNGGQRLYVVPELELVVVVNSAHYGSPLQGAIPFGIFTRLVLPAVKD